MQLQTRPMTTSEEETLNRFQDVVLELGRLEKETDDLQSLDISSQRQGAERLYGEVRALDGSIVELSTCVEHYRKFGKFAPTLLTYLDRITRLHSAVETHIPSRRIAQPNAFTNPFEMAAPGTDGTSGTALGKLKQE